jgi:transposase
MDQKNDIVLAVDYHDRNMTIRWFDCATGEEKVLKRPTTEKSIAGLVRSAAAQAAPSGGRAVWIMESTTGWARVKRIVEPLGRFVLANVLQMPLPPKARRKKTDKVDTRRLLREYLNGMLPQSFTARRALREIRRLTAARESLVSRRTAVRNWINRYLAHETWCSRTGLWSGRGMERLRAIAASLRGLDGMTLSVKLDELEGLDELVGRVERQLLAVCRHWPEAQWVDEVYGIAPIGAVSILARIGPIERFGDAEELIAFAGLAPGVQQSDGTRHDGKIGGGGTDKHLRHYLIEASIWARRIPRYAGTYARVRARRGKKIARLVVARMILRSVYKMLRDRVRFDGAAVA